MMKLYDITEKPLKIYGLAVADSEKRQFFRLPEEALERFPQYGYLGRRAAGGRVRFQTDAKKLYVKMTLAGTKEDINIPLSGSAGADIYLGKGTEATYLGYIAPKTHTEGEITVEKTFDLTGEEVLVTINLPRMIISSRCRSASRRARSYGKHPSIPWKSRSYFTVPRLQRADAHPDPEMLTPVSSADGWMRTTVTWVFPAAHGAKRISRNILRDFPR